MNEEIRFLAAEVKIENLGETLPKLFLAMRMAGLLETEAALLLKTVAEGTGMPVGPLKSDWVAYCKTHTQAPEKGLDDLLGGAEPWPEEVDGASLLDRIETAFRRHVVMAPAAFAVSAAWCAMTYTPDLFEALPLMIITSPVLRCGKSTLLNVFAKLVNRALSASSISAAAICRTIEKYTPTLLVDECDAFLEANQEVRGILNSGFTKGSAHVIRCQGDEHEPTMFSTWCPKILAGIGRRAATLEDRGVVLELQRKGKDEPVRRMKPYLADFSEICRMLARWTADHAAGLESAEPVLPEQLNDRECDVWRPLCQVAAVAGGAWPEKIFRAALELTGREITSESDLSRVAILADIRNAFFSAGNPDWLQTSALLAALTLDDERPWKTWNKGKPLDARGLGCLLRDFGVHSKNLRAEGPNHVVKAYLREQFSDPWRRYLSATFPAEHCLNTVTPILSATSATDSVFNGINTLRLAPVSRVEAGAIQLNNNMLADVADVADELPPPGSKEGLSAEQLRIFNETLEEVKGGVAC